MNNKLAVVSLVILSLLQVGFSSVCNEPPLNDNFGTDWDYKNIENWSSVSSTCKLNGQSPIDLNVRNVRVDPKSKISIQTLQNDQTQATANLTKKGYTIRGFANNSRLHLEDLAGVPTYQLQYFDYRIGSEHTFNGQRYDGELHFVHYAECDQWKNYPSQIAILVVFLTIDSQARENYFLNKLSNYANSNSNIGDLNNVSFNLKNDVLGWFESNQVSYLHYTGTLTQPPCTSGVEWYFVSQPLRIRKEVILALKNYFLLQNFLDGQKFIEGTNTRPIQESKIVPNKGVIWFWEDQQEILYAGDLDDTAEWAQVWAIPIAMFFFLFIVIIIVGLWKLSEIQRHKLLHLHDNEEEHQPLEPQHVQIPETELHTVKNPHNGNQIQS